MHRRVVVTGVGLISPLSASVTGTFQGLCNLDLGVKIIPETEYPGFADLPIKVAGFLPSDFDMAGFLKQAGIVKNVYNALSIASCKAAFEDSQLIVADETSENIGIIFGSDKSSAWDLRKTTEKVLEGGYAKLDRFIIPKILVSQSVGTAALALKIKGYANAITAGYATGQLAVSDAYRAIMLNHADAMVAGSAEVDFDENILMSLYKSGLLSRNNDEDACKPFDIARDGIVYSVGTGAMVLESLEHALARNANIYAEIVSTACVSNVAMTPENKGPERVMRNVMEKGNISADDVSFVNADAPGLKSWDLWEAAAIEKLCKAANVTSHKGNLGHMMSASGICQSIITVLALKNQIVPPIANLLIPVNENLNYVCLAPDKTPSTYGISNSFTYDGGCFSSILYKNYSK